MRRYTGLAYIWNVMCCAERPFTIPVLVHIAIVVCVCVEFIDAKVLNSTRYRKIQQKPLWSDRIRIRVRQSACACVLAHAAGSVNGQNSFFTTYLRLVRPLLSIDVWKKSKLIENRIHLTWIRMIADRAWNSLIVTISPNISIEVTRRHSIHLH